MKNIKIWIGLAYLILLFGFLYFLFSKFSIEEITTYNFIRQNREYLLNLREANIILISIVFIFFAILWILLQGFGLPLVLASGFLFGPYLGTIIVVTSLSLGTTLIYIFANYFFRDLIKEKFLNKFKNLENKFKHNELSYMIIFRIIGSIPLQIQNLIPCMFSVSTKNFFIGTIVGMMPQAFILSSLGSGLANEIGKNVEPPSLTALISSSEIYVPIIVFFILMMLIFLIKNIFYKN